MLADEVIVIPSAAKNDIKIIRAYPRHPREEITRLTAA
jgi:hypothetical protein